MNGHDVAIGECIATRLEDGRFRIEQADPRIMITAELLDEWRSGNAAPGVRLEGDLLYLNGVNRKVIYRIGEKVPNQLAYYAEWPD